MPVSYTLFFSSFFFPPARNVRRGEGGAFSFIVTHQSVDVKDGEGTRGVSREEGDFGL